MKTIRAVVVDLDDTLLRRDKTVSAYTIEVLRQCREKGVKLLIATARSSSAKRFFPPGLFDGFVQMNGAVGFADGEKVYERLIPSAVYVPFLLEMDKAGIRAAAKIDGAHYTNFAMPGKDYHLADFAALSERAERLYARADAHGEADAVRRALPPSLWVYFSKDSHAFVTDVEATKGHAVAAVLAHWGISASDAVAFGDDKNDADMLAYCGAGVAMGNAIDAVKAAADDVCMDCDDDGVARWLLSHVLYKK